MLWTDSDFAYLACVHFMDYACMDSFLFVSMTIGLFGRHVCVIWLNSRENLP